MSNPLLRPNDPRFAKPSPFEADGTNKFSEGKEVVAAKAVNEDGSTAPDDNIYSGSAESNPYQPRYEVSQSHRACCCWFWHLQGCWVPLSEWRR